FEGIPPISTNKGMKIGFNLRQDLPVLIRPKNLPVVTDAWKLLTWSRNGQTINVKNPSPYVVRLAQNITFLPSGGEGTIK
ncbi:fimbrial biogenesis chaperone StjC, partial [Salmonella enterica]